MVSCPHRLRRASASASASAGAGAGVGVGVGVLTVLLLLAGALAGPAGGAQLLGGRRQTAIERAFLTQPAHRHQQIVSVRASTVSPTWAVLESAAPGRGGGHPSSGSGGLRVLRTYFHLVHGGERAGQPPPGVQADLSQDFKVAVLYTGSGSETIRYQQSYPSVCAGAGAFLDQQAVSVSPMSWSVRYVVALDAPAAALSSRLGATLVPTVTFDAQASSLNATEHLTQTSIDSGCSGPPSRLDCVERFSLPGSPLDGIFSVVPGIGTEIGVPIVARAAGACDPDQFTLGPSLWDSGATTALLPRLGLAGGALPAHPYAPVSVSWPTGSAAVIQGFATSPCQGISGVCSDSLHWNGRVQLEPIQGG